MISVVESCVYVDSHLRCQGRAQCTGNGRLRVLEADKCAVAVTYRAGAQLWLLGRQVLLFSEQSRIVLLIKEKNRMVRGLVGRAGGGEWGDPSSRLAPVCVCWVPAPFGSAGAAREGVADPPVPAAVWECTLPGLCRYLFGWCYDFKCGERPANAESGNQSAI